MTTFQQHVRHKVALVQVPVDVLDPAGVVHVALALLLPVLAVEAVPVPLPGRAGLAVGVEDGLDDLVQLLRDVL